MGNEDGNSRPAYNPESEKAICASNAQWSNQASAKKLVNKGSTRVDTYK